MSNILLFSPVIISKRNDLVSNYLYIDKNQNLQFGNTYKPHPDDAPATLEKISQIVRLLAADPVNAKNRVFIKNVCKINEKIDIHNARGVPGILKRLFGIEWIKKIEIGDLPKKERSNVKYEPGVHTEKSPVIGSRVAELSAIQDKMKEEPILCDFEQKIYQPENIYLIPNSKKDEADKFAREFYIEYISKYSQFGFNEHNIVAFKYTGASGLLTDQVYIIEGSQWNPWEACASVENRHGRYNEKYGHYLPPHVVAYHELMHVEEIHHQMKKERLGEDGRELMTTIKTIILLDLVYKKIHGLDEWSLVDYGKSIKIGQREISLGALANFYRQQERIKGNLSDALISSESIDFLKGNSYYR